MTRSLLPFLSVLASVALSGCEVGPDFERPKAPDVTGYTAEKLAPETASSATKGGDAQRFVDDLDVPGQWWELFHSEPLNALIDQSLKANPDLKAAQAALRQAMENLEAQKAALFPTVQANFTPQRFKTSAQLSPTLATPATYFNLFTTQLSVSYPLDIWGGTRRSIESTRAEAESQRYQLEATYLTLTSNVVAAAIQEASLKAQIAATEDIIKVETESLGLLRKQLQLGQAAGGDVAAQEATLAQAAATLPPLQKSLAQQRDLLAALAGRFPSDPPAETFDLDSLVLPTEVPVTLPAKLIENRPDLRAAEEDLHSASAQVGVAIANILPNLTLSASGGSTTTAIGQLFQQGTSFWSVGASLTQTIFDGGALLAKRRAADDALDQAMAQYESAVLSAFQNVADSLRALQSDADAVKDNLAAERAAARSLEIAKRQLQLGSISYLGLLNAEQTYEQSVLGLVQAKAARYADTAALFQALGGGWWNRQDVQPDRAPEVAEANVAR
jgi:NodT family efflux transporter outer membrane factor (OMF) lipoprotein